MLNGYFCADPDAAQIVLTAKLGLQKYKHELARFKLECQDVKIKDLTTERDLFLEGTTI